MTDAQRQENNHTKSQQLNPEYWALLDLTIKTLEEEKFRPRIQDAWRSPVLQLAAFNSGHSKVKWGFHNATTPNGHPDGLAVDLLSEDYPEPANDQRLWPDSFRLYLQRLAAISQLHKLHTGIMWGLSPEERKGLAAAIASGTIWKGDIGWDPTHVEPNGLTLAAAKAGIRVWS